MNKDEFPLGLTYDDVLLIPQRSKVRHRADVSAETYLTKKIKLKIPFVSANMDTVTESKMAIALAQLGGIGIIHRFMTIEEQAAQVQKVKRFQGFIVEKPYTFFENQSLIKACEKMEHAGVSSFIILDKEQKVIGILCRRDIIFEKNLNKPIKEVMTPFNRLVYAPPKVTLQKAKSIFQKYKIEKLPLLDKGRKLKGLITSRSIVEHEKHPQSTKDSLSRLVTGAAVGAVGDYMERTKALLSAGADVIVIDVAHGHNKIALEAAKNIRSQFKDIQLIGGNVATSKGAADLAKIGVDAVKVGIGSGGICTTRLVAGVGVPQLTAIFECSRALRKFKIPIISDGGTNFAGDITKALAAGANTVMLAGWFAGTSESPGEIIFRYNQKFKIHRGSASFMATTDRYARNKHNIALNTIVPEGVEALVPYKGTVKDVVYQLLGGLRSGMSYCNAFSIRELQKNARFIRITQAGWQESKAHNINTI